MSRSDRLPAGWRVAAVTTYQGGKERTRDVRGQSNPPTDATLQHASRVIVEYTDPESGEKEYRRAYGPWDNLDALADVISDTIQELSPTGGGK